MAWRFTGRARVDPQHPEAFGVCDRCGFWHNLANLHYQHEWRGQRLMNIRLRVCPRCMDVPFIFNKPIVYPPDPVPIRDPRPQNFTIADNGSPTVPPLPWPTQPEGLPPRQPLYLTDDQGRIITDDAGTPLLADGSPAHPDGTVPAFPVYVTPPLPPLPPEIEMEP